MDEEDGRLGPRAQKSGRVDVLPDASMKSLCHSPKPLHRVHPISDLKSRPDFCAHQDLTKVRECHENVPGK